MSVRKANVLEENFILTDETGFLNSLDKKAAYLDAQTALGVFYDIVRTSNDGMLSYYGSGYDPDKWKKIAPYISGQIKWKGEDGNLWRDVFADGKMTTYVPKTQTQPKASVQKATEDTIRVEKNRSKKENQKTNTAKTVSNDISLIQTTALKQNEILKEATKKYLETIATDVDINEGCVEEILSSVKTMLKDKGIGVDDGDFTEEQSERINNVHSMFSKFCAYITGTKSFNDKAMTEGMVEVIAKRLADKGYTVYFPTQYIDNNGKIRTSDTYRRKA